MEQAISRELTHHQYLRSRLEEEFPDGYPRGPEQST
jgi:hypothetical protein